MVNCSRDKLKLSHDMSADQGRVVNGKDYFFLEKNI